MVDRYRMADDIERVVQNVCIPPCDVDTASYMAGILSEEVLESLNASTIHELLSSFLIDAGATEEQALDMCRRVAAGLQSHKDVAKTDAVSKQVDFQNATALRRPFNANAFLAGGFEGFHDPCLGLQKVNVNFNSQMSISESLKLQAALQKERAKQLKLMREWEKAKAPLPSPLKKHGSAQLEKIIDIIVNSFSVAVGGRELLKDAFLKIVVGRKYGLIGRNGIGKSTFIGALVRHEIPGISKNISIGCVEQELSEAQMNMIVIDAVLAVDQERSDLLQEEKQILSKPQTEEAGKRLTLVYSRLEEIDSEAAEPEAASILAGLGFTPEMQKQKIKDFSGGWRVRVALARALFASPDILCLDEPTNHLDLHAVSWLTEHLLNSPGTCIIVSHARSFLNDVCTDIIDFKDQQLKYYHGDYDTYEKVKAEDERLQQRRFEAQQMKRDHIQKFIDKFRYNASRATLVQSRIKTLEKLPMLDAVSNDPSLVFKFGVPEDVPSPVLQLSQTWFTYKKGDKVPGPNSDDWILKDVDVSVDLQTRMAICGVNGSGKTTLLKMLIGQHEPVKGLCRKASKLRIGFFSQHHVDQLDLTLNSVQQLQEKFPDDGIKNEDARSYLGRFGIGGLLALEPLYILSGGQKSRVAIALMAYKNPHIMILDEPTNHLDLDAVQALIVALSEFEGAVVVVSHDTHLLSCIVDEILHVDPKTKTVIQYKGDIESYRRDTLKKRI